MAPRITSSATLVGHIWWSGDRFAYTCGGGMVRVCARRALKRKRLKLSIPKPVPIPADITGPSMAGPKCRDTRAINVGGRHLSRDIGWCRPARANTAQHDPTWSADTVTRKPSKEFSERFYSLLLVYVCHCEILYFIRQSISNVGLLCQMSAVKKHNFLYNTAD